MEGRETGLMDLIDEDLVPEAREARLREGVTLYPQDNMATPCDKSDVCY